MYIAVNNMGQSQLFSKSSVGPLESLQQLPGFLHVVISFIFFSLSYYFSYIFLLSLKTQCDFSNTVNL